MMATNFLSFITRLAVFIFLAACNLNSNTASSPNLDSTLRAISFEINGFRLELNNGKENCEVSYRKADAVNERSTKLLLDLASPCEFVRHPKLGTPLHYSYGKENNYWVLIVVGGPPNHEAHDDLMPSGCGTEFQALRIYSNNIQTGSKVGAEKRINLACPSGGLDEIYFAEYSGGS
ncbi:MAG: hypothetical protein IT172_10025 [Acidobacteria bacterium]|nr:hypothetical protein [Acidobacteriota bacterium]